MGVVIFVRCMCTCVCVARACVYTFYVVSHGLLVFVLHQCTFFYTFVQRGYVKAFFFFCICWSTLVYHDGLMVPWVL